MPASDRSRNDLLSPPLRSLALVFLVVAIFYFAREVLLPFALAVLLSFLLAPLATRLQRWGVHRVGAVVMTVTLAFAVIGGLGYVLVKQAIEVAAELPKHENRLVERVRSLRKTSSSTLSEAAETVERVEKELVKAEDTTKTPGDDPSNFRLRDALFGEEPLPVQIVDTAFTPLKVMNDLAPVLEIGGSAAIVIVFVIFILLERENLRDRIIRLAGTSRVYVTTQALEDAAKRVSRYLLMQLIVNSTYGAVVGVGLYFIGLPNAILWGLLATILRFLPYVGPMIGAITPIAMSLAVFEGWQQPALTIVLFVVAELVTNNVLEPWLYGSSTGVSTLAIVIGAVFWTWIWGPVGLVLATPLIVCLTVMARHVPQLAFLNILLADEPPLELKYRFYQRLLAQDYEDASDVASEFLRNGSLDELYETMFVPALALAERDRDAGRLTAVQESFVYESIAELVEETHSDFEISSANAAPPQEPVKPDDKGQAEVTDVEADTGDEETEEPEEVEDLEESAPPRRILCLVAEDEADRISAVMFAQLLTGQGYQAEAAETIGASEELIRRIENENIEGVVLSAIAPGASMRVRNVCRKLRRRLPHRFLLVGLWHTPSRMERMRDALKKAGADALTSSFKEGIEFVRDALPLPADPKSDEKEAAREKMEAAKTTV